ncbi:MAG: extracellular solute-binding protein [Firmicutes bacterium]|nr:extracellular solute-binding protein [Bacillota bacterium]
MKKRKRTAAALLLAALTVAFTGCTGGGDLSIDIDRTISDQKLDYTLFANEMAVRDKPNRVVDKWEEMFNVDFHFEGSGADWMETLSLRINADDMPDMFFFVPNDTNYMSAYSNFVDKQLIIPISDLATPEDTPNLYTLINSKEFEDLKINGKMYFVPSFTSDFNNCIYVRQDWLDNLNMKAPETIGEFEAMLKAFTEDDPDGNGRNDTYGMSASKVFEWLSYFRISFGCQPGWSKDENGQWQLDAFTDNYRDFLIWLRGLYEKGYIKNEFYLYDETDALNDFYNGKCGVMLYNGARATGGVAYNMRRLNKDAVLSILPMPDGVAQGGYTTNGNWWGCWSIAYSAKEPMRLAKFLDYMLSEEGMKERLYGLEGIHYTEDANGSIVLNFEERLKEGSFFGATDDGMPRDYFAIGSYFGAPYRMENGTPVNDTDSCIYSEPELAELSIRYANENLIRFFPRDTMMLGVEYAKTYSKVADRIYTYSIRIVSGTVGVDEGLKSMKAAADSDGYAKLQQIIRDTYPD